MCQAIKLDGTCACLNDASNSTKSDNFGLSSLQQAPYSFLSPLNCKNGSKQAQVRPIWLLDMWAAGHLRRHSQVVNKLVNKSFWLDPNASCTLASSWRFCRTEFLWKGYQTLFFPTQTQKEKSGLATQDYVGIKHIALLHTRSCDQFCTHFKINWIPLAQVCDAALTWSSYAHLLGETAHQIWGKLCKLFTRHSKSKQTFMFFHFFHKRKIAITHKRINWSG